MAIACDIWMWDPSASDSTKWNPLALGILLGSIIVSIVLFHCMVDLEVNTHQKILSWLDSKSVGVLTALPENVNCLSAPHDSSQCLHSSSKRSDALFSPQTDIYYIFLNKIIRKIFCSTWGKQFVSLLRYLSGEDIWLGILRKIGASSVHYF